METLYILSVPGMKESLLINKNKPIENFSAELDWDSEDGHGISSSLNPCG